MMEFYPAIIRGKTIELESDPGLLAGQRVEVVILPVPRERMPGEGLLRSAGASADDPDFDADMAEIERYRRSATFRETAE
jgi:hypothetical protein